MTTNDSLQSLIGGLGDPTRDKLASTSYTMPFIDDMQLLNAYRGSWLPRKIVNIPAYDAVRRWRSWQAAEAEIEKLEAEEKRLLLRQKVLEARIRARLFGGAAIYLGTGDADLMEPFDPARARNGGLRYLTVMSRLECSAGPLDYDPTSEFYNRPKYYRVYGKDVHSSRLAVFHGATDPEPRMQFGVNVGWGDSVLLAVYDAVRNADSVMANIASLVFEANVDVFGVPDFIDQLADPEYERRMLTRFGLAAMNKSINRSILRDAAETFDRKTISFAGLPDLVDRFMITASGAADIPAVRLFGQSPAGLNATGESDIRNYYDAVSSSQELEITPTMTRLDEALIWSALGKRPAEVHYTWSSLWQISDDERSKIGKTTAETIEIIGRTGLFSNEALAKTAANSFVEHSVFPGLEAAVDEDPVDFDADIDEPEPAPARVPVQDARPMSLYMRRDVVNVEAIRKWAREQGFPTVQEHLHVTIAFSRDPVDWIKVGSPWESEMKLPAGGPRLMERFGEAIVLQFASNELEWRHQRVLDVGGKSDHPEYQPHITIFWEMPGMTKIDLDQVEPYRGEIILGPEIFEEIDEGWRA